MRTRRARCVVSGLAALVVLAGCGGSSPPEATPPAASSAGSPTPSVTPVTPAPSASPTDPATSSAPPPTPPPAACTVPPGLAGQDVERLPTTDRVIALTFDGGAGAQGATSILDTLDRRDVPATFFLTGGFARSFPEVAARIGAEHTVGNHSDTHPDLTTLSEAAITGEVRAAERAVRSATGEDPRRFFRFPFGARDARTIRVLNALCYVPFRWTVDTLGWKGTSGGQSVGTVERRVLDGAAPGGIVLMHVGANPDDGSTLDADALPQIVTGLRAAGYRLVSLDRVLDAAP